MSAAAFVQGLLDLEGSSLTPILVSLVKKDASMLDAFGKGTSEKIAAAKALLYDHLTQAREPSGPAIEKTKQERIPDHIHDRWAEATHTLNSEASPLENTREGPHREKTRVR